MRRRTSSRGRHSGSFGWFENESAPTVSVQLGMDFGQKVSAFDIAIGRASARKIVGAFFDGATFTRATGIWKHTQNGGLTTHLFFVPESEATKGPIDQQRKAFIERARSCASFLADTFEQDAVAMLTIADSSGPRLEFVHSESQVKGPMTLLAPEAQRMAIDARNLARINRVKGDTVWGD